MNHKLFIVSLPLAFFFAISGFAQKQTLSLGDILQRYYDLEQLAVLPRTGEKSAMFSSYDQNSKYNSETGKYENWTANYDGDGYLYEEDGYRVMADIKGTGFINRIWSAKPEAGEIIIEIDGKKVLTSSAEDLFNPEVSPFNFPGLVYTSAKGRNIYVPICFQKSIRIMAVKDWGKFYHFNYTLFPEGHEVPSFTGEFNEDEKVILKELEKKAYASRDIISGDIIYDKVFSLGGSKSEIINIEGQKAITRFEVEVAGGDFYDDLLRNIELEIYWDNNSAPAVRCPLSAFFGANVHQPKKLSQFSSVPVGIHNKTLYSNWYMPFQKAAKIVITNKSQRGIKLKGIIHTEEHTLVDGEFGYFHTDWHDGLKKIENERWPDRFLLDLNGTGRFCGMMLTVYNPISGLEYGYGLKEMFACWWWGEGDEKFYVDGEKFPSTYGTGTEDYFGYAWGWPTEFTFPYHNQTFTTAEGIEESEKNAAYYVKNGNRVVSMNRFQIADNVPFLNSFFATLEQYYPDERPIKYQTALYYYINHP